MSSQSLVEKLRASQAKIRAANTSNSPTPAKPTTNKPTVSKPSIPSTAKKSMPTLPKKPTATTPSPAPKVESVEDKKAAMKEALSSGTGNAVLGTLRERANAKRDSAARDNISKLRSLSTKVAEHINKQEAAGLYQLGEHTDEELIGFNTDAFLSNLQNLDAATVEKTPDIRTFSNAIRKNLEEYPELVHILNDRQLQIITSGVLTLAGVETAPKTESGKKAAAKRELEKAKQSVSLSDFEV